MDALFPLRIFVSVIQYGNMSSAGRHLGLSPASVSRHVGALESRLGCQLVNRTSRTVTLTEAGELYYARVQQILSQLADLDESIASLQSSPRGTLRIHSRMLVGNLHIVPLLPAFTAAYPEVTIDLQLSNRLAGLVEENIDVDIRIGKLVDSTLAARKLASATRLLCATPGYIERHGRPERPEDLANHNCLTYRTSLARAVWRFSADGGEVESVQVGGRFQTDNGLALHAMMMSGLGLALMPDWSVRREIASGRLLRLLANHDISLSEFDNGIFAVFQKSRLMSPKVRVFVDFLAQALQDRLAEDPAG